MTESPIDFGSSDPQEKKSGFPWLIIVGVVAVMSVAGVWIRHAKQAQEGTVAALEQQLNTQKATLDAEREKVFDLTRKLESMKNAIAYGQVPDRLKAVDEYNKVANQQRLQREKVKTLADEYNLNVAKLHDLQ